MYNSWLCLIMTLSPLVFKYSDVLVPTFIVLDSLPHASRYCRLTGAALRKTRFELSEPACPGALWPLRCCRPPQHPRTPPNPLPKTGLGCTRAKDRFVLFITQEATSGTHRNFRGTSAGPRKKVLLVKT